jgi:hypothetical protein
VSLDYASSSGSKGRDVQAVLEEQFRTNLMIRGFDSWNVPLYKSLNSMPSLPHLSGLGRASTGNEISQHLSLPSCDFVLTACAEDASVNIWSTRAGLTRVAAFNFKLQASIDPEGSMQRARLHFLEYDLVELAGGIKIYSRRGSTRVQASKQSEPESGASAKQAEADTDAEKGDGELMRALFDESASMEGACAQLDGPATTLSTLDELQAEIEGEASDEDPSTVDDVFAAEELGAELNKVVREKAEAALQKSEQEKKVASKAEKKASPQPLDKKGASKASKQASTVEPTEPNLDFLG